MYVKVYRYQIQEDKLKEYLQIQQEVLKIYRKYIDIDVIHLQNNLSPTNWIEMMIYKGEEEDYQKNMNRINMQQEILEYFNAFQITLIPGTKIIEEDYHQILLDGLGL